MKTENWIAKGTAGHDTHGQSAVYCGNTGKNVAIVYDGKAHAALIAAAPELLAALEKCAFDLAADIRHEEKPGNKRLMTDAVLSAKKHHFAEARAAIAATKGGN